MKSTLATLAAAGLLLISTGITSAAANPSASAARGVHDVAAAQTSFVVEVNSRKNRNRAIGVAAGVAALAIIGAAAQADRPSRRSYDPHRNTRKKSTNRNVSKRSSGDRRSGGFDRNYCEANWNYCHGSGQNSRRCDRFWSSCVGG